MVGHIDPPGVLVGVQITKWSSWVFWVLWVIWVSIPNNVVFLCLILVVSSLSAPFPRSSLLRTVNRVPSTRLSQIQRVFTTHYYVWAHKLLVFSSGFRTTKIPSSQCIYPICTTHRLVSEVGDVFSSTVKHRVLERVFSVIVVFDWPYLVLGVYLFLYYSPSCRVLEWPMEGPWPVPDLEGKSFKLGNDVLGSLFLRSPLLYTCTGLCWIGHQPFCCRTSRSHSSGDECSSLYLKRFRTLRGPETASSVSCFWDRDVYRVVEGETVQKDLDNVSK